MKRRCQNCGYIEKLQDGQDLDSKGDCPECGEFTWEEGV